MAADEFFRGPRFQNFVLDTLQAAEEALLQLLHAIGLAPDTHGQPAWPFAQRLATESLVIDGGLTRQLALLITGLLFAAALVIAGALWRRGRRPLVGLALVSLVSLAVLPWPSGSLVLTAAHPTSFHRSPTGFDVASIDRGMALFQAHCASCHGTDGRGEGPLASSLAVWPPRLGGELLWRRAEGEVYWRILHGLQDRHGTPTMPGFAGQLEDAQVWSLIDAMRALAAGTSAREESAWAHPVRAPDAWLRCGAGGLARRLSSLRGQRVRLIAGDAAASTTREDPRLVTIGLAPVSRASPVTCVIDQPGAYAAYARVSGVAPADFGGAQLIVDRDGWLRAFGRPGRAEWSPGDLLCRSPGATPDSSSAPASRDGLGDLIAAIDADPIRSRSQGLAHGRR